MKDSGSEVFELKERQGLLEIITIFAPSRSGARPIKRVWRRFEGESHGGPDPDSLPEEVFSVLNKARNRGSKRLDAQSFRSRLAKALSKGNQYEPTNTQPIIDALVETGILEKEERLDRQRNVNAIYLHFTEWGDSILSSKFGETTVDPLEDLKAHLLGHLSLCQRDEISPLFKRQLSLAEGNEPVAIDIGEGSSVAYISKTQSITYMKIVDFFGFVGAHPHGFPLEYKEISGRLNPDSKDSVKDLEGLREQISFVAENELGQSLEDMGIKGSHILYWVPFHGDIRPERHIIWGSVPAISTRDIRNVAVFHSDSKVLCLVENRTTLDVLAEEDFRLRGWTVLCTEGMPKIALYTLLSKIEPLHQMKVFLWCDWDLGGLRIMENLMDRFPSPNAANARIVPHPHITGRAVPIPERFLCHANPQIQAIAKDIVLHGAVYQEESLSIYSPDHLLAMATSE